MVLEELFQFPGYLNLMVSEELIEVARFLK